MLIFTQIKNNYPLGSSKILTMTQRFLLAFLFILGIHITTHAQIRDTVSISIPPYSDTTCVGSQIKFTAVESNDTFSGTSFKWYINSIYQGVTTDTFLTTAPADGDVVTCVLYFTNSFGLADSFRSNAITIYRRSMVPARVMTGIIVGSNPDCPGHQLTFRAYPISGGYNPRFQWMINRAPVSGSDSLIFRRYFGGADTVSVRMVADSATCSTYDTAFSIAVPIIHIRYTATLSIASNLRDTICMGAVDTFTAVAAGYGSGATFQWYRDSVAIAGGTAPQYITDSLRDGDSIYCVLRTTDSCVLNPVVYSDTVRVIRVIRNLNSNADAVIAMGSNPGCLDSPIRFQALIDSFGRNPYMVWRINGFDFNVGFDTITRYFANTDVVSFFIRATDTGCYVRDSIATPPVLIVRFPTPRAPWLSLIGNMLVADSSGSGATYTWYYGTYPGTLIPGASGPTYHPMVLGTYYCVKDSLSCPSGPSNELYISLLKVNDLTVIEPKVYPNPTTGEVTLDWYGQKVNRTVTVTNAVGTTLMQQAIENEAQHTLDLNSLADGLYFIQVKDEAGKSKTYTVSLNRK